MGGRKGRMGEKVQGLRSTNWSVQNRQGDVKNTIGNRVAKELICIAHGHELRGKIAEGNGRYQVEGGKRAK